MKTKTILAISITLLITVFNDPATAQKDLTYADVITANDLESHISFLASPLLKGRLNGAPELEIAQQYIVSQAKLLGLKPANGDSYFQSYSITKNSIDPDRTSIEVITDEKDTVTIKLPVYQLVPTGPSDFTFEGEVVFAGYGLNLDKHGYNDFDNINTEGKILLVMNRAPSTDDGKEFLFDDTNWSSFMSIQLKLSSLLFSKAKAVLFVMDPKSGFASLEERYPGYAGELNSSKTLKGEKPRTFELPGMPRIIFVHRSVADELLKGSGHTLEELQNKIDTSLKPGSFEIEGKLLRFAEAAKSEDITLRNIAAYIEGSDTDLKKEYVVFFCPH